MEFKQKGMEKQKKLSTVKMTKVTENKNSQKRQILL